MRPFPQVWMLTCVSLLAPAIAAHAQLPFEELAIGRVRFSSGGDPPALGSAPRKFFKTKLTLRGEFTPSIEGDGIDLATEPVRLSFGQFETLLDPTDDSYASGNEATLRIKVKALNHIKRLVIKQSSSGYQFNLRATKLNIPEPDVLTIAIGDDFGQVDLATGERISAAPRVQGLVGAGRPSSGGGGTLVNVACAAGTCSGRTDEQGFFSILGAAGSTVLKLDATAVARPPLSQVARNLTVDLGTTDAGLLVTPMLVAGVGETVWVGTQSNAKIIEYPHDAADPEASLIIPKDSTVAFAQNGVQGKSVVISRVAADSIPAPLPPGVGAAAMFAAEPAGMTITPCGDLLFANPIADLGDGSVVDIYGLERTTGTWKVVGTGTVFADGSLIFAGGTLCELSSFFVPCTAETTDIVADVRFRGTKVARVPVFVHGHTVKTDSSGKEGRNLHVTGVSGGCEGDANTITAYAALPIAEHYAYFAGRSSAVAVVPDGVTDLGDIELTACGNNVAEGFEECDGADLREQTCESLGNDGGLLACNESCTLDTSNCVACGDGVRGPGEECDLPDEGFCPGGCRTDCTCPPVCGDGVRNQASERCDGLDDILCPGRCDGDCACPPPSTTTTTLPPDECPLAFVLRPETRALSVSGATQLEIGFTGLGHDRDVPGGFPISLAVDCAGDSGPCGECDVLGLAPTTGRCRSAPRISCDTIDGPDADNCGGGHCDAYILPPLHNVWGGGPGCFVERLLSDVGGTIDNESGATSIDFTLGADFYVGFGPTQPCPVCRGDDVPNDGLRDGVCDKGPSDGLPCDAHGVDPTFGDTSLDCYPDPGMKATFAPLERHLELSSTPDVLPFATPCDFPLAGQACPCAVCDGDISIGCATSQDCVDAGTTGPCDRRGDGVSRRPNDCEFGSCIDSGDGIHGVCEFGPQEHYCDGVLFAHGTPFLQCLSNSDCDAAAVSCDGDCGDCTISKPRSCFLDPIISNAAAGVNRVLLSDVLCIARGPLAALDSVAGLAGPERVTMEFDLRRVFPAQ